MIVFGSSTNTTRQCENIISLNGFKCSTHFTYCTFIRAQAIEVCSNNFSGCFMILANVFWQCFDFPLQSIMLKNHVEINPTMARCFLMRRALKCLFRWSIKILTHNEQRHRNGFTMCYVMKLLKEQGTLDTFNMLNKVLNLCMFLRCAFWQWCERLMTRFFH